MDKKLAEEILEQIRERCPAAEMEITEGAFKIHLQTGASGQQIKYLASWRDFAGIYVRNGHLVAVFDRIEC